MYWLVKLPNDVKYIIMTYLRKSIKEELKNELFEFLSTKSNYDIILWPPASSTVQLAVNVLYKIKCKRNFYFVECNPLSLTNLT